MTAAPVGPAEPVGRVVERLDDEGVEQALDFLGGTSPSGVGLHARSSARTAARKARASIARVTQRSQEG